MNATWAAAKDVYHFRYMQQTYTEKEHLELLALAYTQYEGIGYFNAMQKAIAVYAYHQQLLLGFMPNRYARYQVQQQTDNDVEYQTA